MKIDLKQVRIGSDFEMFIEDSGGKLISAIPFIEGTKDNPFPVGDGHAIQHDGALLEGNVPAVTLNQGDTMWENFQFVIGAFQERLPKDLKVKCCPNGEYEPDQLTEPEARQFGCDPDFNAWEQGNINKKPDANETNERCCGLHFHISFPGASPANVMRLVRILDVYVALPMLFVDEDNKRRKLYGKAGCFRFKDYGNVAGVEYRVLSNSVLKEKEIFDFVWAGIRTSLLAYNKGHDFLELADPLQESINNYNLSLAEELADTLKIDIYEKV